MRWHRTGLWSFILTHWWNGKMEALKSSANTNVSILLTWPSQALSPRLTIHLLYTFGSLLPCPHILKVYLARNYTHLDTVNKWDLTSKHCAVMGFEIWTLIAFNSWWYCIKSSSCDGLKFFEMPQRINKDWEFLTDCSTSKLMRLDQEALIY